MCVCVCVCVGVGVGVCVWVGVCVCVCVCVCVYPDGHSYLKTPRTKTTEVSLTHVNFFDFLC